MPENLMEAAENVTSTPNEPDPDEARLTVPPSGSKYLTYALYALLTVAVLVGGVLVASRLFGGSDAAAVASQAAPTSAKTEATVASTPAALPAACQGDLSQAGEQRKWYCTGFMPWKQAVDADLARLHERGGEGATPSLVWLLIGALAASNIVTWMVLWRRRKTS